MPYLTQGTAEELYLAFGKEWLIEQDSFFDVQQDLPKVRFLGSEEQANHYIQQWSSLTPTQSRCYVPGNVSAHNLLQLLTPENDSDKKNEIYLDFAYVNDKKELCGLMIVYNKNNPKLWTIGHVKNTNFYPEKRKVILLSGASLQPLIKSSNHDVNSLPVDLSKNPLVDSVDSVFLQTIMQEIINPESGAINTNYVRIDQLLRFLNVNNEKGRVSDPVSLNVCDPKLLLAKNTTLNLMMKHGLHLSFPLLIDALSESGKLAKEIERIKLTNDFKVNKQLLLMTIVFYEQQVLLNNKAFLQTHVFSKVSNSFQWNDAQIQLIPFLIKNKFNTEQFQLILSEKVWYHTINLLIQLGLTDDIQEIKEILTNPQKLADLHYIYSLKEESHKKLCLVFWVKGTLKPDDYTNIVQSMNKYPLLAETLLDLDRQKTQSIENLQEIALTPAKLLQKIILFQFADVFNQYQLKESFIEELNVKDLNSLIPSFKVLYSVNNSVPEAFDVFLKNNLIELSDKLEIQELKTLIKSFKMGNHGNNITSKQLGLELMHKLNELSLKDLRSIGGRSFSQSFKLLKKINNIEPDTFALAIMNDTKGRILRLFLPQLAKISDKNNRKKLIEVLYMGVKTGAINQCDILKEITEKKLLESAKELHERIICVKQMVTMSFKEEIIDFTAQENDKATRFRKIIVKVEEQCKKITERLRNSKYDETKISASPTIDFFASRVLNNKSSNKKIKLWKMAEQEYRMKLYAIAYEGLNNPDIDIMTQINLANKKILDIVDPENRSWFSRALIFIANIFITAFTLGYANIVKEKNTGNRRFFDHTQSGEEMSVLNKEVETLLKPSPSKG